MLNNEMISIFIPVYKESDFLEPLLRGLLEDPYREKEIFVVIDEPTERSIRISEVFSSDNVHFIFNGERKGKANVLNEIVKDSKGTIFLFLDSDILIDGGKESFLEIISREMRDAEMIEVKKGVVKDSFIARIVNYDYLSFNLTNWYFSSRMGRCLGVNGAAFAIRREVFERLGGFRRVICEDLDLATRSFVAGVRFKFVDKVSVYTKVPSRWREWFNQRRRWGIGAAFWFREHFKLLKRIVCKHPGIILPSLLFIFPALPLFLVSLFIPDDLSLKALYVSLILLSAKASILLPPMALTSTALSMLRSFLIVVGNLTIYSLIFYVVAKKFHFNFNPFEFAIFYFIVAPIWLLIVIVSLFKVYIRPENIRVDWKV
ncbi:MAG: glycosyltransferase family 2 protein [Candidatus Bathyarchaeia archaeon]